MSTFTLSALCAAINTVPPSAAPDIKITGITYDSRNVHPGNAFFATPGVHTDGHRFIPVAIQNGARVVVHSDDLSPEVTSASRDVFFFQAGDVRKALSAAAAAYYGHPSKKLRVIGVTGTDGKSTTVFLIYQLLSMLGRNAGFLSTVSMLTDREIVKNHYRQSTPEAVEINMILNQMVENGKEFAVIEATSHGLSEKTSRLADIDFDAAVFTNLTHEHLEFHGSVEQYRWDKGNLFRFLDRSTRAEHTFGVLNADDPASAYFTTLTSRPMLRYSVTSPEVDLFAGDIAPDSAGNTFTIHTAGTSIPARINLPGAVNVENALAAVLAVSGAAAVSPQELIPFLPQLESVPGRMVPVGEALPFACIVDYAHTPGSFEKLLPLVRQFTPGRLIVLFGSAGERDVEKRPMLGEIAARLTDIIVLADEDPRGEPPQKILQDVAAGVRKAGTGKAEGESLFIIENRPQAIRKAISLAREGDTLLFLGKGHETSIIYADGPHPWDEAEAVRDALEEAGYLPRETAQSRTT